MRVVAAFLLCACSLQRTGIVSPVADGGGDSAIALRDAGPLCMPAAEVCDLADNDCDGAIDEDIDVVPCDSDDSDRCEDDGLRCQGGALACADDGDPSAELEVCDGADNDCDPATADGSAEPIGAACDGVDDDLCLEGVVTGCTDGMLACDDATDSSDDFDCDGLDLDCDGRVDDDADCPCLHVLREDGHSYVYCSEDGDRMNWWEARDDCDSFGYVLVEVDDAAEQAWLAANAPNTADHWIGANAMGDENDWRWVDGSPATFTNWRTGEPNNGLGMQDEDCAEIDPDRTDATAPGGWNDDPCWFDNRYICEAAP